MSEKSYRSVSRGRRLTAQEAAEYREVRRRVMEEIPPAATNVVQQAVTQLRAERERLGLSLADVAQRTGMTRENICRLESEERNVTLRTLQRYARGLGCNIVIGLEPAKGKAKKRSA
jgi:ribosome-binding protein aMBF1 (putative translation factor)